MRILEKILGFNKKFNFPFLQYKPGSIKSEKDLLIEKLIWVIVIFSISLSVGLYFVYKSLQIKYPEETIGIQSHLRENLPSENLPNN